LIEAGSPKAQPRDLQLKPSTVCHALFDSPAKKKKLDRASLAVPPKATHKRRTKSITSVSHKSIARVATELKPDLLGFGAPEPRKKTHKKTASGIRVSHSRDRDPGFDWLAVPKPLSAQHQLFAQNRKNHRPSEATSKRSSKTDQHPLHDLSHSSHKYSLPRSFLHAAKHGVEHASSLTHQAPRHSQPTAARRDSGCEQPAPEFEKSHLIIRDAQVRLSEQLRPRFEAEQSDGGILDSTDRFRPLESNLNKDGGRNTKYTDHSDHFGSKEELPSQRESQRPRPDSFLNFNAADFDQDSLYKFSANEYESTKFVRPLGRSPQGPAQTALRNSQASGDDILII
jgi:hypothetical protein